MRDIFNRDVQDNDVVLFPFVKRSGYRNNTTTVWLSYGIVKGKRVYLLDNDGKLIYKIINHPEGMMHLLNQYELSQDVVDKVEKIREAMSEKIKK